MIMLRFGAALAVTLLLAACGSSDMARIAPPGGLEVASKNARPGVTAPRYQLAGLRIAVPDDLRVSEANGFYPIADIVWRGEALGDRHGQVRAIFAEGIQRGMAGVTAGVPVVAEVEVLRFHCLTEKTRYTVGGVHSIRFLLTLRDPVTGRVIDGPRKVVADVKASGGSKAVAEDAAGRTQRVVIVEDLARVFRRELGGTAALPAANATTIRGLQPTADIANAALAGAGVPTKAVDAAIPIVPATPALRADAAVPQVVPARAVSPWDWIDLPPAGLLR